MKDSPSKEDATTDAAAAAAPSAGAEASGIPASMGVKHPLQNSWTLWFDHTKQRLAKKDWGNHIREVISFDTVEDFWGVFNNIVPASELSSGSNYHIFKTGIAPKWEDAANSHGGRWVFTNPARFRAEKLDNLWMYCLLALIGEGLEDEDVAESEICGVALNIRKKEDRICIWTRTASKKEETVKIGQRLKACLEIPESKKVVYRAHEDENKGRGRSKKTSRYQV